MSIFGDGSVFDKLSSIISTSVIGTKLRTSINSGFAPLTNFLGMSIDELQQTVSVSSQFQESPFNYNQANRIYGQVSSLAPDQSSSSAFLQEYQRFQDDYFSTVGNKNNLAMGQTASANMLRKMGKIDLSILNYEQRKRLKGIFFNRVMKGSDLFNEVGLPGLSMPTANLYRSAFRMNVDYGQEMHPAQVLLSKMVLNIDPKKRGLEAISFNSSDIMTVDRLLQSTQNLKNAGLGNPQRGIANIFKDPTKKIFTLDVETSGVFAGAQVRSMSIASNVLDQSGKLQRVDVLDNFNVLFESQQMRGTIVTTMNDGASSLNQFIARMEGGTGTAGPRMLAMGDEGEIFLDEATKFLDKLMEADVITGHNIGFDIDKISNTMMAMPAFSRHAEANRALVSFLERRNQSGYVIDTLEIARGYLENEFNQLMERQGITDTLEKSQKFVQTVYSREVLSRVTVGGSASWASVENIAMNTNLLDLIYKQDLDNGTTEATKLLQGGAAHTSEVDTKLQSYMAQFMHTGDLKFTRDPNQSIRLDETGQNFVREMKNRILRSSAITATTNLADVRHISENVFQALISNNRLLSGVSILGTAEELLTPDVVASEFTQKGISPLTEGFIGYSEKDRKSVFSAIVPDPTSGSIGTGSDISLSVEGVNLTAVREILERARRSEAEAIAKVSDLGISLGRASRAEELFQLAQVRASSTPAASISTDTVSAEKLTQALTSLTTSFGGQKIADTHISELRKEMSKGGGAFNLFGPLSEYNYDQSKAISSLLTEVGDPFAGLVTVSDRQFSARMAQATSNLTQEVGRISEAALLNSDTADIGLAKNFLFTKYSKEMSELGLSMWNTQKKSSILSMNLENEVSKILMPTNVAKEAYERLKNPGMDAADRTVRGLGNIGLSVVDGQDTVNLVWHATRELDKQQTNELGKHVLDILDEQRSIIAFGKTADLNIKEDIAIATSLRSRLGISDGQKISQAAGLEQDEIFKSFIKSMTERGVVVGSVQGPTARSVVANLTAMNIPIDNDVILSQFTSRMLEVEGLSDGHIALSMFSDKSAARIAGLEDRLSQADSVFAGFLNNIAERMTEIQGGQEGELTSGLLKTLVGKPVDTAFDAADFYRRNKTNLTMGALGLAAAIVGYYGFNKYEERQLYNESFEQQPYEKGRQVSSMNDYAGAGYSLNSLRTDPLSTAGVVGNLDRGKINHTSMSPFKNNHLYGGQL